MTHQRKVPSDRCTVLGQGLEDSRVSGDFGDLEVAGFTVLGLKVLGRYKVFRFRF